jgi:hypothetical protein
MLSFFTELNRKPTPMGVFDFVTHSVCPIVHTADDTSVMETLEAMPSITASARNIIGKSPYHLGPSSIACRENPYGAAVVPNLDGRRVCLSDNDPRQRGNFAAAWNLGLVATAARGGVDVMALGAVTGKQGFVLGDGVTPVFHVLAGLAGSSGARLFDTRSTAPARVEVLAYQTKQGRYLWLANLTGEIQAVNIAGLPGSAALHVISGSAFNKLRRRPSFMATPGIRLKKVGQILLQPYVVARVAST